MLLLCGRLLQFIQAGAVGEEDNEERDKGVIAMSKTMDPEATDGVIKIYGIGE